MTITENPLYYFYKAIKIIQYTCVVTRYKILRMDKTCQWQKAIKVFRQSFYFPHILTQIVKRLLLSTKGILGIERRN